MDVQTVTTSLDALLHRATSTESEEPDPLAIEAFCVVLRKEQDGAYIASRLIASRMHSDNPKIALLTLQVLEMAMKKCGAVFHAEIGKFKFLNEMVKLVSPKYLGNKTSQPVKDKVLLLMHTWIFDYPKEIKIKEAYLMLQKQGVIKNEYPSILNDQTEQFNKNSIDQAKLQQSNKQVINIQDEEKSKLLKKLLQSKNPEDIQAANRLIKNMVREDEKRMELLQQQKSEISSVNTNISLLNEMLEQYKPGVSSEEEIQLIKEIYVNCKDLQPKIYRIAQDIQNQEDVLCEVLQASDDLLQVLDKYKKLIENKVPNSNLPEASNVSLLDLNISCNSDRLIDSSDTINTFAANTPQSNELVDIFLSVEPDGAPSTDSLLKPLNLQEISQDQEQDDSSKRISAMDELNSIGESLLKSSLADGNRAPSFTKPAKIPMNSLLKTKEENNEAANTCPNNKELDLNILIADCIASVPSSKTGNGNNSSSLDDLMIDILGTKEKDQK